MQIKNLSGEKDFEFLNPYFSGYETIFLSSGKEVKIKKYFFRFESWKGAPIPNTYNNKPVIDWNGEPVFAELAALRLFQSYGWNGAWIDSYHQKFRDGLPDVAAPVELPEEKKKILDAARAQIGKSAGCWDVFAWKDNQMFFVELKRSKKDRIQDSQIKWLETLLKNGFNSDNFSIIEWDLKNKILTQ